MSDPKADRKTNYFGSFLGTVGSGRSTPGPSPGTPATPSTADPSGDDPLNGVLRALLGGDQSVKDLLVYTGNSLTKALHIANQLVELGYADHVEGDTWRITDRGRDVATRL